jgi:hypothetical protein
MRIEIWVASTRGVLSMTSGRLKLPTERNSSYSTAEQSSVGRAPLKGGVADI